MSDAGFDKVFDAGFDKPFDYAANLSGSTSQVSHMADPDIAPFRRRDFEITIEVDGIDPARVDEFVAAIYRAKPSRLDNTIAIEVTHRPDQQVNRTVQMICERGVRSLTVRAVHPELLIRADPRSYLKFEYEDGRVVDQWTEMSHRDGDEPMVDVLRISFHKKMVTDAVWEAK